MRRQRNVNVVVNYPIAMAVHTFTAPGPCFSDVADKRDDSAFTGTFACDRSKELFSIYWRSRNAGIGVPVAIYQGAAIDCILHDLEIIDGYFNGAIRRA
ncbi:MAG TPA: hypothetical protein VGF82_01660 [Terracidiphilus sp.]